MSDDAGPSLAAVLGAVIATERNARGMTQQRLATLSGLHPMALSKIERGIQQDVGVGTLQRLAGALSEAGAVTTASGLLATAEGWQGRLRKAGAGPTLKGEILAATMTLLAMND